MKRGVGMTKRVAVIGAGLTGIGCLAELRRAGYDARLYERNDDIGGVWHPSNCYSGLSLHGASAAFEYHDFPLPGTVDKSRPISSAEVYDYLRTYFHHKDLYRHSEFNVSVQKISWSSLKREFTLQMVKRGVDEAQSATFDYIVYTHGFSARTLPEIEGAERFAGQVFHSFDMTEATLAELVRSGRKVVLVGGSKTATDLILRFDRHGYQVKWLYRKNYWFLRSDVLIKILSSRLAGRSNGWFRRTVVFAGDLLGTKLPRLQLALWRAFGLVHTFGARHWDFTKFHRGRIEAAAMSKLSGYAERNGVTGEIAGFAKEGVKLADGRTLACDVVVFCTGSSPHGSLIEIEKDGVPFDLVAAKGMYRSRVIPALPRLIFTAFHIFSFGVVNGLMTGRWVMKFIESDFSEKYLSKHAASFDPSFFARPSVLFDSSRPINVNLSEMLSPFFKSGELSQREYFKWLWHVTFATGGVEPLDFAGPRSEGPARSSAQIAQNS